MGNKLVYKEVLIGHYRSTNLSILFSYFDIQCMDEAFFLSMEPLIIVLMFRIAEL